MKKPMNPYLITLLAAISLCSGAALAAPIVYQASLTGEAENPDVTTTGSGFTTVVYDDALHTLQIDIAFTGLLGNTTAAHIHCCAPTPLDNAGVATQTPSFDSFPLGVTAGSYSHLFDLTQLSSFNLAYVTNNGGTLATAEAALAAGLANGQAYLNIHTSSFGGGEIRGMLTQRVPEPATLLLLALGMGLMHIWAKPGKTPLTAGT